MSAATALHDLRVGGRSGGRPFGGRNDHLRLVRPGEVSGAAHATPMRITRRGRLTITLTLAATLVIVGIAMTTMLATGAAGPGETVTVEPGQTLSEVAAEHLPALPVNEGVVRLQLENELSSLHVHAGQELVIPAP